MQNVQGNPWFWAGKSQVQFVRELERDAVMLLGAVTALPFIKPKADVNAIKARKAALIASGILKVPKVSASSPVKP